MRTIKILDVSKWEWEAMNKKKWYHLFWKSGYQWIGGVIFLLFTDFHYNQLVSAVWFIVAGINLYRGFQWYRVDR
ncbi:hypothetical protein EGCR1_06540 [Enterococcus gilvus]|nr:hypothetical protein EGCR1_06540 [Enterococcus gilvus]